MLPMSPKCPPATQLYNIKDHIYSTLYFCIVSPNKMHSFIPLLQALAPSWRVLFPPKGGVGMICVNIEFRGFCCRLLIFSDERVPKNLNRFQLSSGWVSFCNEIQHVSCDQVRVRRAYLFLLQI